jgi:hypothetical protein
VAPAFVLVETLKARDVCADDVPAAVVLEGFAAGATR